MMFLDSHICMLYLHFAIEKKDEIWLSLMTKAHTPTEIFPKQRYNTKNRHQNVDNTTIADLLKTVSWRNEATQMLWLN